MSYKRGLEIGSALMDMGFRFTNAMRSQEEWDAKTKDKEKEKLTYDYANKLMSDPEFKPEDADNELSNIAFFDAQILTTKKKYDNELLTSKGLSNKREQEAAKRDEGLKMVDAFVAEKNPDKKIALGMEWFNKYPVTGNKMNSLTVMDGAELQNWNGDINKAKDLSIDKLEQFMGTYYKDKTKQLGMGFVGGRAIAKQNEKAFLNREKFKNRKTGEYLYRYTGLIDPNGEETPPFLSKQNNPNAPPNEWNPIRPEDIDLAGYDRIKDEPWELTAKEKAKEALDTETAEAELADKKAATELKKAQSGYYEKGGAE